MRAIDTVLFDLDDTLHDDTAAYRAAARSVARDVARERGIDAQALADAYERAATAFWSALTAEHLTRAIGDERERMWHEALREVGIDDRALAPRCADGLRARARRRARAVAGRAGRARRAARARLQARPGDERLRRHAPREDRPARPRERMDAFFIADEVGMIKPDPELYRHACRVLGSEPARTAMVGDRYERDVRGAPTRSACSPSRSTSTGSRIPRGRSASRTPSSRRSRVAQRAPLRRLVGPARPARSSS